MDKLEKKRYQNKVSQRKHRARQSARMEILEKEIAGLRSKLREQKCVKMCNSEIENRDMKVKLRQAVELVNNLKKVLEDALEDPGEDMEELLPGSLEFGGEQKTVTSSSDHALRLEPGFIEQDVKVKEILDDSSIESETINDHILKADSEGTSEWSRDFWSAFCYPVPKLSFRQRTIRSSFETIESEFLNSFSQLNLDTTKPDFILNPRLLSLVTMYSERYLQVVPRLRNFTLALGSTKWVCAQLLLSCYHRANCGPLGTFLYEENAVETNDPSVSYLKKQLMLGLEERIQTGSFEKAINILFPTVARAMILPENPSEVVMPSYFRPTRHQMDCIRQHTRYDQFFNFIIWPELRDSLLEKHTHLEQMEIIGIIEELMDNVVLEVGSKVFFMCELLSVMSAKDVRPAISFPQLVQFGVAQPRNWKLSKSFGDKYSDVVPRSIVCEIDDTIEENILREITRPQFSTGTFEKPSI